MQSRRVGERRRWPQLAEAKAASTGAARGGGGGALWAQDLGSAALHGPLHRRNTQIVCHVREESLHCCLLLFLPLSRVKKS